MDDCSTSSPLHIDPLRLIEAVTRGRGEPLADIEVLGSVDSTNRWLLARRRDETPYRGRVCLAEHQTAGRGRRGRDWVDSPGGSILLSMGWTFDRPSQLSGLSLVVGVALRRALVERGVEGIGLKWPNDLLCRGKKVAGILIEVESENEQCSVVMGIGLNVLLGEESGEMIDQPWTDLTTISGRDVDRTAVAAGLITHLLAALERFEQEGFSPFQNEWEEADALRGCSVVVSGGSSPIRGVASGVYEEGSLKLRLEDGTFCRCRAGEVSVRRS